MIEWIIGWAISSRTCFLIEKYFRRILFMKWHSDHSSSNLADDEFKTIHDDYNNAKAAFMAYLNEENNPKTKKGLMGQLIENPIDRFINKTLDNIREKNNIQHNIIHEKINNLYDKVNQFHCEASFVLLDSVKLRKKIIFRIINQITIGAKNQTFFDNPSNKLNKIKKKLKRLKGNIVSSNFTQQTAIVQEKITVLKNSIIASNDADPVKLDANLQPITSFRIFLPNKMRMPLRHPQINF